MAGSRLIAALIQAVALILVARQEGPAHFGHMAAFLGVVVVLQALFDLGFSTYITKLRASDPASNQIPLAIRLYQYLGLALLSCLLLAALSFSWLNGQPWWSLLALGASGYVERQSDVRLTIAVADGDVWKNSVTLVCRRGIALALLWVITNAGVDGVTGFGLASLFGSVIGLWLSILFVPLDKSTRRPSWQNFREVFGVSRHFWINSLGAQLRNFDVVIVTALASPVVAGYYGAIARSLNPLLLLSSSVAAVVLPMAVRFRTLRIRSLMAPVVFILVILSVVYMVMAFNSKTLVVLAFGESFAPAVDGFRVVIIGLIFASFSSVQTSLLQAMDKERVAGRVTACTSVIALLGVSIGVLVGDVTGAAVGLAASFALQSVFLLVFGTLATSTRRSAATVTEPSLLANEKH